MKYILIIAVFFCFFQTHCIMQLDEERLSFIQQAIQKIDAFYAIDTYKRALLLERDFEGFDYHIFEGREKYDNLKEFLKKRSTEIKNVLEDEKDKRSIDFLIFDDYIIPYFKSASPLDLRFDVYYYYLGKIKDNLKNKHNMLNKKLFPTKFFIIKEALLHKIKQSFCILGKNFLN